MFLDNQMLQILRLPGLKFPKIYTRFFYRLNRFVFFNNYLKKIDEWTKHIVTILNFVLFPLFCKVKISINFKDWEKLLVVVLSLSDFTERFDLKITRKWSELKGVVVTFLDIIWSFGMKQWSISMNVLSLRLIASPRLTVSNPEFDAKISSLFFLFCSDNESCSLQQKRTLSVILFGSYSPVHSWSKKYSRRFLGNKGS